MAQVWVSAWLRACANTKRIYECALLLSLQNEGVCIFTLVNVNPDKLREGT